MPMQLEYAIMNDASIQLYFLIITIIIKSTRA